MIGSHGFPLSAPSTVDYIGWFSSTEPALHPWENPTRLSCVILLMVFWACFANVLVRIFSLVLFCTIFVWFWYQDNAGFIKWVGKCFLLFHILGSWVISKCFVQYRSIWRFSSYLYGTDFKFNFIIISKAILLNFNYFKLAKVCFMTQGMVYLDELKKNLYSAIIMCRVS